ncbi:MAG: hypothetical protein JSV80_13140 [Acidobacteriota bacterium]|nr:MAG: hypothetical protein JSV80_13140 [Acidobacteriota bacterium]
MSATIRRVDYYSAMVHDRPGEAYWMLSQLTAARVNLLAFTAIPFGPGQMQVLLFPEHVDEMARAIEEHGLTLTGPQHAILIQGDDRLGALRELHGTLADADINVYQSSGITDGKGGFAYLIYVAPEDVERATRALGV